MLISVVIPLFNKEKYILRAIRSVLAQTHADFELIIVDDGSTDKSADEAKSVTDPRIQFVEQVNGGASKARNAGAKLARAEWVAFLDADDEYEPTFLNEVGKFLQAHQKCELSLIGANYYVGSRLRTAIFKPVKTGVYNYFALFRNQRSPNSSSTTIVNKTKFIEVGGFPESVEHFEDWITWMKLALVGDFGFISEPLGLYHRIEGSIAHTKCEPKALFNYAGLLTKTVLEYTKTKSIELQKKKIALNCMSEFSVNISAILAHDGEKVLAIQMLKFIRLCDLVGNRRPRWGHLLRNLIIPQFVKRLL